MVLAFFWKILLFLRKVFLFWHFMNWVFRLGLAIFTFIYCLTVFEVNTEYITNTWGDEYDFYLHNGGSSNSAKPVKIFQADSPVVLLNSSIEFPGYFDKTPCSFSYSEDHHADGGKKRYLIHRTLLI